MIKKHRPGPGTRALGVAVMAAGVVALASCAGGEYASKQTKVPCKLRESSEQSCSGDRVGIKVIAVGSGCEVPELFDIVVDLKDADADNDRVRLKIHDPGGLGAHFDPDSGVTFQGGSSPYWKFEGTDGTVARIKYVGPAKPSPGAASSHFSVHILADHASPPACRVSDPVIGNN